MDYSNSPNSSAVNSTNFLWKKCPICGNAVLRENATVVGDDWFHASCTFPPIPTAPNYPVYPSPWDYPIRYHQHPVTIA